MVPRRRRILESVVHVGRVGINMHSKHLSAGAFCAESITAEEQNDSQNRQSDRQMTGGSRRRQDISLTWSIEFAV